MRSCYQGSNNGVDHRIDLFLFFWASQLLITLLFLLRSEQQPRVRGWLLASVDGQTIGLVPANYVKVLGKRRGRKHAEMERLAQVQQGGAQASQTAQGLSPDLAAASTGSVERMLESAYSEAPASFSVGTSGSSVSSSAVLNIPEKTDLWWLCVQS